MLVADSNLQGFQLRADKPDFVAVRNLIKKRVAAEHIPSVSVAVARRGQFLWEEGFGWADRENQVRADPHTPYYLASVTKPITATAVMILQERKQLDLDRAINDYLGPAKLTSPLWNPAQATLRRVATHTAGLTTFALTCYGTSCRFSSDEIISRYGVLFWPPGDHFDYSNLGYGLLGEVVASVSHRSLNDFLQTEIFRPLGMDRTSLGVPPGLEKMAAVRYSHAHGRQPNAVTATPGASGVYASAHDLALFGMFHLKARLSSQKAILLDSSIDLMQNETVATGDGARYGMGWWINDDLNGYRGVLGQGGTDDASTRLQLIPSEGIVVAVLTNTGSTLPMEIVDETLAELLPSYREKRARVIKNERPSPPKVNLPSPAVAGDWSGVIKTYRRDLPLALSISKSGAVQAKLASGPQTRVDDPQFDGRKLTGHMPGDLDTKDDTGPEPYSLEFELYLRDGELYGAITTLPRAGKHRIARLSYWVSLKKQV
jgi:CubicO group peptidase (beta-lactamase class C family)